MSSWRDTILNNFVPNVSKLTLVADPDDLLTEEILALKLRRRGFDLLEFNDPVEFRYAHESKYRSIQDRSEPANLVVILRAQNAGLESESLPCDLLLAGMVTYRPATRLFSARWRIQRCKRHCLDMESALFALAGRCSTAPTRSRIRPRRGACRLQPG